MPEIQDGNDVELSKVMRTVEVIEVKTVLGI